MGDLGCGVIFLVAMMMISRNAAGFLKVQWAPGCSTVDFESVIQWFISVIHLLRIYSISSFSLCRKVNKPGNGYSMIFSILVEYLLEMEIKRGFQAVMKTLEGIQADTRKLVIVPKRFRVLKPRFPIASK